MLRYLSTYSHFHPPVFQYTLKKVPFYARCCHPYVLSPIDGYLYPHLPCFIYVSLVTIFHKIQHWYFAASLPGWPDSGAHKCQSPESQQLVFYPN